MIQSLGYPHKMPFPPSVKLPTLPTMLYLGWIVPIEPVGIID